MHDPLILAVQIAESVGIESSSSRDVKCLQLARWMREDGAISGNAPILASLACALDPRLREVSTLRWEAALFLLAAGSSRHFKKLGIPAPAFVRGWTRANLEAFVTKAKTPKRKRRR